MNSSVTISIFGLFLVYASVSTALQCYSCPGTGNDNCNTGICYAADPPFGFCTKTVTSNNGVPTYLKGCGNNTSGQTPQQMTCITTPVDQILSITACNCQNKDFCNNANMDKSFALMITGMIVYLAFVTFKCLL